MKNRSEAIRNSQAGFGMIEVLVSLTIFSIVALGFTKNLMTTMAQHKYVLVNEAMHDLAIERIEIYSSINPLEMDSASHDETENTASVEYLSNMTFTRVTDVTENADGSREIDVTVSPNHARYSSKSVNLSTTFIRW